MLLSDFYIHNLFFFFFNDTATTEIYTLSLHDALPIFEPQGARRGLRRPVAHPLAAGPQQVAADLDLAAGAARRRDRKSTRLNSSHQIISYAVFCLKKKKRQSQPNRAVATYQAKTKRIV